MSFSLQKEFARKALHFLLLAIPLIFYFYGKKTGLLIFIPITITVVWLDFLRRKNAKIKEIFAKIFGIVLRPHELEGSKLCGSSWVALATCLTFFIFKTEIAITGFTILVISDALAALVGKAYPSRPFFEKSVNGALAFFISGVFILIGCGLIFDMKVWFYIFGLIALGCVTIIESRPSLIGIDDNFTIPVFFCLVLTFFDLVWNVV